MVSILPTEKIYFSGISMLLVAPDEYDYGEERWRGIGLIKGRVVVVIFTERRPNQIRFISLRKANQEEQRAYEEAIKDKLGAN